MAIYEYLAAEEICSMREEMKFPAKVILVSEDG